MLYMGLRPRWKSPLFCCLIPLRVLRSRELDLRAVFPRSGITRISLEENARERGACKKRTHKEMLGWEIKFSYYNHIYNKSSITPLRLHADRAQNLHSHEVLAVELSDGSLSHFFTWVFKYNAGLALPRHIVKHAHIKHITNLNAR